MWLLYEGESEVVPSGMPVGEVVVMDIGMGFNRVSDIGIPKGVNITRVWDVNAHWGAIHKGVGQYDWSVLDAYMTKAKAAGINRVIYVVGGCPRWLSQHPDSTSAAPWLGPGSNAMPTDFGPYADFLGALLARYPGQFYAIEVWNEPQEKIFLDPYDATTLKRLSAMTKLTHTIVKQNAPKTLVVSASVLPRNSSGGMHRAETYLKALAVDGWNVDYITCHIYPEVGKDGNGWVAMLDQVRTSLVGLGAPKARFPWVTETHFNLLGSDPGDVIAQWVREVYAGMKADGVSVCVWYTWDKQTDIGGAPLTLDSTYWRSIALYAPMY